MPAAVELEMTVQWGEIDSLGHVNNTRYFAWFESARMELLRALGLGVSGRPRRGPTLAHTRADFRVPVFWPATVRIRAEVSRLGGSSFDVDYQVLGSEGTLHAEGMSVLVLFDHEEQRPVPLPDDLRASLAGEDGSSGVGESP